MSLSKHVQRMAYPYKTDRPSKLKTHMTKIINKCNACKIDTQRFFHKGNESYPNGKQDQGCEAEGCTTVCHTIQYKTA